MPSPIHDFPARRLRARAGVCRTILSASTTALALIGCMPRPAAAQIPSIADPAAARELHPLVRTHPELAARRALVAAAEARVRAAGLRRPATLDADVEEVPRGLDLGGSGTARIGVSREFTNGAERGAQREVAMRQWDRARLELQLVERSLVARADQLLVEAASALAIDRRLAAEDSLLAGAEEALRGRFAVGDARYVDVLRLRSERLRAQGERARASADARVARRALLALAAAEGQRAESTIDTAIRRQLGRQATGTLPPVPAVDSLVALAGFVRLADVEIARAESQRRLVQARQRPAVVASLGIQRFANEGGGHSVGPTLGASVVLPFTAPHATRAARTVADREVDAALADRRAAVAHVRGDVGAAIERYEAAREQLALYDATLLRAAREEREGALASYRGGALSLLELLDFERALARAEIDRLRSQVDAARALADLVTGVAGVGEDQHGSPAVVGEAGA